MDTMKPSDNELKSLLCGFLNEPCESEVLEFKTAGNDYDFDKLGKYFSALSNEANIRSVKDAWLIFGVNDQRKISGTKYRNDKASLGSLKYEIAQQTGGISFREIYELEAEGKRVLMLRIPARI